MMEQDFLNVGSGPKLCCNLSQLRMYESLSILPRQLSFLNKCVRFTGVVEYCPFSQMAQTIDGEGDLCAAYVSKNKFM